MTTSARKVSPKSNPSLPCIRYSVVVSVRQERVLQALRDRLGKSGGYTLGRSFIFRVALDEFLRNPACGTILAERRSAEIMERAER